MFLKIQGMGEWVRLLLDSIKHLSVWRVCSAKYMTSRNKMSASHPLEAECFPVATM